MKGLRKLLIQQRETSQQWKKWSFFYNLPSPSLPHFLSLFSLQIFWITWKYFIFLWVLCKFYNPAKFSNHLVLLLLRPYPKEMDIGVSVFIYSRVVWKSMCRLFLQNINWCFSYLYGTIANFWKEYINKFLGVSFFDMNNTRVNLNATNKANEPYSN